MLNSIKDLWSRAFGPKLRCKPGDLCLIVKQYEGQLVRGDKVKLPDRLGIVVRVVSHDGNTWDFEEPIEAKVDLGDCTLTITIFGIADEFLQPLPKLDEPAEEMSVYAIRRRAAVQATLPVAQL